MNAKIANIMEKIYYLLSNDEKNNELTDVFEKYLLLDFHYPTPYYKHRNFLEKKDKDVIFDNLYIADDFVVYGAIYNCDLRIGISKSANIYIVYDILCKTGNIIMGLNNTGYLFDILCKFFINPLHYKHKEYYLMLNPHKFQILLNSTLKELNLELLGEKEFKLGFIRFLNTENDYVLK
jgi:hypothetical protein